MPWFIGVRNEVSQYLHDPRQFTLQEARYWFHGARIAYLVVEIPSVGPIGYIRRRHLSSAVVEVGLDLEPTFQGLGHAKPVYAQLAAGLHSRGVDTICLRVLNSNHRAHRLYRELGFREVPLLHGESDVFMYTHPNRLIDAYRETVHSLDRGKR